MPPSLRLRHLDVVAIQRRQPSLDGTGAIESRRLVKESLRSRPAEGQILSKVRRDCGGQPVHESHPDWIADAHSASRLGVCQQGVDPAS